MVLKNAFFIKIELFHYKLRGRGVRVPEFGG